MDDQRGGWKGLDTGLVRDHLHAATAVGRMAGAAKAVELGYGIEADSGPSGRLGGWAIAGIPKDAWQVHAQRSAKIEAAVGADASYRSRSVAARATRDRKGHDHVEDLWGDLGHLSGPELAAPGGRRYRAGDRVVTLAPGPGGAWVTSQRAVVSSVDVEGRSLVATTPDGAELRLGPDDIGAERLAHSYAMTAHRCQGSTSDSTYALEDGGGRELAYVAMSRARRESHVHVVAPDLGSAARHLAWAWRRNAARPGPWPHAGNKPWPSSWPSAGASCPRYHPTRPTSWARYARSTPRSNMTCWTSTKVLAAGRGRERARRPKRCAGPPPATKRRQPP